MTLKTIEKKSLSLIRRNGYDFYDLKADDRDYLIDSTNRIQSLAKKTTEDIIQIGFILIDVKRLLKHGEFQKWYEMELGWSSDTINNFMNVSKRFGEIPNSSEFEHKALYLLARKSTPDSARQEAIELAEEGEKISYRRARDIVSKYKTKPEENEKGIIFNETNENIDWAKWTWNPVTGCKHGCKYCYARDIANRFYKEKFEPTFRPYRLKAPWNTQISKERQSEPGIHNVFVCSMADLFGKWVPQEWIDAVMDKVRQTPQWTYIFLTKNPERMAEIEWPDNAWVGTTVDVQIRVKRAEEAFKNIKAKIKFVSCEPLLERLSFDDLDYFNWVIIGGRSKSTKIPAMQPKREWVLSLMNQAYEADCKIYCKPNLTAMVKEYPI